MGNWQSVDQDIASGTPPTTYQTLDLTSYVGTQQAFCLFAMTRSATDRGSVIRQGFSSQQFSDSVHHGLNFTKMTANKWYLVACPTTASRNVAYSFNSATGTFTLRLLGFCNPSEAGPILTAFNNYNHPVSGWANLDISLYQGVQRAFAVTSYVPVSGNGLLGLRSPGDTRSAAYVADMTFGGANRADLVGSPGAGACVGVVTDTLGVYQHSCDLPAGQINDINWECSEVDNYVHVDAVIGDTVYTANTWNDIDLSTHVAQRALCILKVENGTTGTDQLRLRFRRKGETRDFAPGPSDLSDGPGVHRLNSGTGRAGDMLVETDENGIVQIYPAWFGATSSSVKITLVGYIQGNAPPTISNNTPTGSDESSEVTVGFDCADDGQVNLLELDLDLTTPAPSTINAIVDGVFQPGYSGTINANASNGYDVRLSNHPVFEPGAWQADAYVEDDAAASATLNWSWTVGSMAIVSGSQSSLNAVDIEFDEDPRFLDPLDPNDARNLSNYSITGPASPARLLLSVEYLETNRIRLHYDGAFVAGELYVIGVSNVISTLGHLVNPSPSTFQFIAYGADAAPIPLVEQTSPSDIRNPQTSRDAPTDGSLGTYVVKSGDLDIESARQYLRKRIWRRLGTRKGSMFHLPNYGLELNDKSLYTPTELRRLQNEILQQIGSEDGVRAVAVSIRQLAIGVVLVKISVTDKFGTFTDEGAIGGE